MRLFLTLATATLIFAHQALATLGGQENPSNLSHLGVYHLHETSKNRVKIHEFSNGGKVFAVAWSGKRHPELQNILGEHLIDFQTAIAQARRTHHHGGSFSITVGNIHVEMGGHAGAVYGQTWLTDQVPAGMDLHEIR